jgi:hypothetical protein
MEIAVQQRFTAGQERPFEFLHRNLQRGIGGDLLAQVDAGRWPTRDPRAMSGSITGIR